MIVVKYRKKLNENEMPTRIVQGRIGVDLPDSDRCDVFYVATVVGAKKKTSSSCHQDISLPLNSS